MCIILIVLLLVLYALSYVICHIDKSLKLRMILVVAKAICEVFNNKTIYLSSLKDSIVDFRQIQITFLSLLEGRIRKLHKLGNCFKVVKQ